MPERLKSRKLWTVVLTAVFAGVSEATGFELDPDLMDMLTFTIVSYLIGQSAVDYSKSNETAAKYAAWMATQNGTRNGSSPYGAGQYTGDPLS